MKTTDRIKDVGGRRIWDSRGWPTLEVTITSEQGHLGTGSAPAGASRGSMEAVELRDGGNRLGGRDVNAAIRSVNELIGPVITGMPLDDVVAIDRMLIELDGTPRKSRLGGNAMTATSVAILDAASRSAGMPVWQFLAEVHGLVPSMPLPEIQIFGGGAHASRQLDIQDIMIMVPEADSLAEALEITAEIYHAAGDIMRGNGIHAGVADEGGWWPSFRSNEEALEYTVMAMEKAGEKPGSRVVMSLDLAASEFYHDGRYRLSLDGLDLDPSGMVELVRGWIDNYPIVSIEDPLSESDPNGMSRLTHLLGGTIQVVGDDLLATNRERVARAITRKACNAVLLKVNQVGTITEMIDTLLSARESGWGAIVSARSGETEDVSVSHLAVGTGSGQIKVGSFSRSERMAKWNECLRIEENHPELAFAGGAPLAGTWWGRKQSG